MDIVVFVDKAYRVHLKSANGPIDVYLCPDNIDDDTSAVSDAAVTEPVTGTTDGIFPSDPSASFTVEKQEGRLMCYNGRYYSVMWQNIVTGCEYSSLAHSLTNTTTLIDDSNGAFVHDFQTAIARSIC